MPGFGRRGCGAGREIQEDLTSARDGPHGKAGETPQEETVHSLAGPSGLEAPDAGGQSLGRHPGLKAGQRRPEAKRWMPEPNATWSLDRRRMSKESGSW